MTVSLASTRSPQLTHPPYQKPELLARAPELRLRKAERRFDLFDCAQTPASRAGILDAIELTPWA